MTKKLIFRLVHEQARRNASSAVDAAPAGYVVVISEETRSLEQNALMWPVLREFAKQKQLAVNGLMANLPEETWKDVLTAAFKGEMLQTVIYNGTMILTGTSTSAMGKREFCDFLTWLLSEADNNGIDLSRKASAVQDMRDYIRTNSPPAACVQQPVLHDCGG